VIPFWIIAYLTVGVVFGAVALVRMVASRVEPLERLLVVTGVIAWWPVVVVHDALVFVEEWYVERERRRKVWNETGR
jgi:hypothetical protein